MAGRKKLTRYVTVGGVTYAPGDDLPGEIAEQITNPKAFADPDNASPDVEAEIDETAKAAPARGRAAAAKE